MSVGYDEDMPLMRAGRESGRDSFFGDDDVRGLDDFDGEGDSGSVGAFPSFANRLRGRGGRRESGGWDDEDDFETYHRPDLFDDDEEGESNRLSVYRAPDMGNDEADMDEEERAALKPTFGHRNRMNDPDFVEANRDYFMEMGHSSGGRAPAAKAEPEGPGVFAKAAGAVGNVAAQLGRALGGQSRDGDGTGYRAVGYASTAAKLGGGYVTGVPRLATTIGNTGQGLQALANLTGRNRLASSDAASTKLNADFDAASKASQESLDRANALTAAKAPVGDRFRARVNFLLDAQRQGKLADKVNVEPVLQSTMKQTAGAMNAKIKRATGYEASHDQGARDWDKKNTGVKLTPYARPEVTFGDRVLGETQLAVEAASAVGSAAVGGKVNPELARTGQNKTAILSSAAGLATGGSLAADVLGAIPLVGKPLASVAPTIVGSVGTATGFIPTLGGKSMQDRADQVRMQEDYDNQWGADGKAPLAEQIATRGFLARKQAFNPTTTVDPSARFDPLSSNLVGGAAEAGLPALEFGGGVKEYATEVALTKARAAALPGFEREYKNRLLRRDPDAAPTTLADVALQAKKGLFSKVKEGAEDKALSTVRNLAGQILPDSVAKPGPAPANLSAEDLDRELPGSDAGMSSAEAQELTAQRRAQSQAGYVPMSPVRDASSLFDDEEDAASGVSEEPPMLTAADLDGELPGSDAGVSSAEADALSAQRRAESQAGYAPSRGVGPRMAGEVSALPDFQDEPNEMERAIAAMDAGGSSAAVPQSRMAVERGQGLMPFTSSPFIPRASMPAEAPRRRGGFLGRVSNFFGGMFGRRAR